jgi:2-keto-4-pentenoate hydratase
MKKLIYFSALAFILSLALGIAANAISEIGLGNILMDAHKSKQKHPLVSVYNPTIDAEGAYRVQRAYVEKRLARDQVAGFKGGLGSPARQKKFGLNAPVSGVLFTSGKKTGFNVIERSDFRKLVIETEIGYKVGKPITKPLKNVSELYDYIHAVLPVVELPDAGFAGKIKGVDLIAANVRAAQFIAGTEREFKGINLNNIDITLTLDGKTTLQGKGSNAMGDQLKAAMWLINNVLAQGWKIEPGQIFITGALPKAINGKPGKYVAYFGKLGKISFEVK